MSINPLLISGSNQNNTNHTVSQKPDGDGFVQALEKASGCRTEQQFSKAEYLKERIEYYQSKVTNADEQTYVDMMKYFYENGRKL